MGETFLTYSKETSYTVVKQFEGISTHKIASTSLVVRMRLVEPASMQDAPMDDGQKAHAALVDVLECRSAIVLDQPGRGSCTSDRAFRVHASEQDYWDTWEHVKL